MMMFSALGTFSITEEGAINDNDQEFRIRDRGRHTGQCLQSFIAQVMKAAAKANGGPLTLVQIRARDDGAAALGTGPR